MKVYIGPYKNWWGPYQIVDLLKYVGVSDNTRDKLGDYLANTWLNTVCEKVQEFRGKQKYKIRIDKHDTWSMDHTLSFIVLPMLKQLKETKHGAPFTDDDDVPDELKSTSTAPKEGVWDLDTNHFKRWDWILGEMIWAFEQKVDDDAEDPFFRLPTGQSHYDKEGHLAWQKRKDNGFRLFGKYYEALWD
jgi:hypothetical protein